MPTETIEIPVGYELKKVDEFRYEVVKKVDLPATWNEFCEKTKIKEGEAYINDTSHRCVIGNVSLNRRKYEDKNLVPNTAYADAILAMCQLLQLRNCYRNGWVPNWRDSNEKFCICFCNNNMVVKNFIGTHQIFSFQTKELCDMFYNNFRNLLYLTKPLFD